MTHRVLVADDDRDTTDSLAFLLRLRGHTPLVAYDGPTAVETARREQPDLLLLDLMLSRLDGFAVARRVRSMPGLESVPIVALTGLTGKEVIRRCREEGFSAYMLKPVEPDVVLGMLTRVCPTEASLEAHHLVQP